MSKFDIYFIGCINLSWCWGIYLVCYILKVSKFGESSVLGEVVF